MPNTKKKEDYICRDEFKKNAIMKEKPPLFDIEKPVMIETKPINTLQDPF
jgi:hypothetical protein